MLESTPDLLRASGWIIASIWFLTLLPLWLQLHRSRALEEQVSPPPGEPLPSLAIVVPARNEEDSIHNTISDLLGLHYPLLQVIGINDRSTDQTGQKLEDLRCDPRLQIVHLDRLPEGWIGKNHANWLGASQSESEWILFTDADVRFGPETLQRALKFAMDEQLDHLTIFPKAIVRGLWEEVLVAAFGLFFQLRYQPALVRTRWPFAYVGIGAFNLVRREAYQTIGTHQRLALEVADDVKLGKLIKLAGLRQDFLTSEGSISIRWQVGAKGIITGLTKNAFAACNYSIGATVLISLWILLFCLAPLGLTARFPQPDSFGFLVSSTLTLSAYGVVLRKSCGRLRGTPLFPIAVCLMIYALWRSMIVTLRQGGVRWRETFYPLSELKKDLV